MTISKATPPQQLDDDSLALAFFRLVLPPSGMYCAAIKTKRGKFINEFHPTVDELWQALREADRSGNEAYYAVASFRSNDNRQGDNVEELKCFRLDVDYGEGHAGGEAYATREDALSAVRAFYTETALPQPMVLLSGGGLHVYWPLKTALTRYEWLPYAERLKAACMRLSLKADHIVTADAARILRAPCTTNRKLPGKQRRVELDPRFLDIGPYDLQQFETLLQYELPTPGGTGRAAAKVAPFRLRPKPESLKALPSSRPRGELLKKLLGGLGFNPNDASADASMIADQCGQVGWMRAAKGVLPYPAWFQVIGALLRCKDGEALAHEWSKGHPHYNERETQQKVDDWKEMSGPPTCAGFQNIGGETGKICQACSHLGTITTPLSLGEIAVPPADETAPAPRLLKWELTASGKKKEKSYPNAVLAIDALGIKGRHDIFHDRKLIAGDVPANLGPELSDPIVRAVREAIVARFGFDPSKDHVHQALERLCEKNRFDPASDYFDAVRWDGKPRLDHWLVDCLGAKDTPLNRAFGRKTLVAAVRRARRPGCKFDTMPVLEGKQGTGKSTAIRILAGDENFSDQPIRWDDQKQQQEAVRGVLIHEISELVGLKKADVDNIKSFLSRQSDRCRPAYGRYVEDRPRRCIFIGTTNNGDELGYLADPSGGRRFWPVETGRIDLEALRRDRDQLWAEAVALEASGETLELDPSLYQAAAVEQRKRFAHEPWVELLRNVTGERVGTLERISSGKLLEGVQLRLDASRIGRREYQRLAVAMAALGWSGPKDLRIPSEGSGTVKGYERAAAIPFEIQAAEFL